MIDFPIGQVRRTRMIRYTIMDWEKSLQRHNDRWNNCNAVDNNDMIAVGNLTDRTSLVECLARALNYGQTNMQDFIVEKLNYDLSGLDGALFRAMSPYGQSMRNLLELANRKVLLFDNRDLACIILRLNQDTDHCMSIFFEHYLPRHVLKDQDYFMLDIFHMFGSRTNQVISSYNPWKKEKIP